MSSKKEKKFLTGHDPIAKRIADSLGLSELSINALSIHIDAESIISAECVFFPTEEHLKDFEEQIKHLEGKGVIMGETELFFSSELEDPEESDEQ
jgi:hypothetical protein